jgi:hypothetical protein
MLDIFVQFMLSKKIDFRWNPNSNPIKLSDYDQEISKLVDTQMSQHIYLNRITKQEAVI